MIIIPVFFREPLQKNTTTKDLLNDWTSDMRQQRTKLHHALSDNSCIPPETPIVVKVTAPNTFRKKSTFTYQQSTPNTGARVAESKERVKTSGCEHNGRDCEYNG